MALITSGCGRLVLVPQHQEGSERSLAIDKCAEGHEQDWDCHPVTLFLTNRYGVRVVLLPEQRDGSAG